MTGGIAVRRLGRLLLLVVVAVLLTVQTLFAGIQQAYFSSNSQGGFHPVGIAFNFRISAFAPGDPPNEPRMLVTRPLTGNPRQLRQLDAEEAFNPSLSDFVVRAILPARPTNNTAYVDSVAAIPDLLSAASANAGFTPNDILVSQGLRVSVVSGAEGPVTVSTLVTITGSTCPADNTGNSDLLVDRWGLQFGGHAILTCQGSAGREIWLINGAGTSSLLTTLTGTYSGRADITAPNFRDCGGCLALVADGSSVVTLIGRDQAGNATFPAPIAVGALSGLTGNRQTLTVPPRVYEFGASGGCLFGTVPSANAIRKFPCSVDQNGDAYVYGDALSGDLLIFTAGGNVIRVSADALVASVQVDSAVGTYEDLAFPNLRVVQLIVHQPANANPNQGVQGNIVFHILSGPNLPAPGKTWAETVDFNSIRFGYSGAQDSVHGNCGPVGTDLNGDGKGELKCSAAASEALCDAGAIPCLVTGFTKNQTAFEGGD